MNEGVSSVFGTLSSNKYGKWYFSIVERARLKKMDGYVEKHHVIPRSLGGNNETSNVVELTGREHFVCHLLLSKIFPFGSRERAKMAYALHKMVYGSQKERYIFTSWQYEYVRKIHKENMSGDSNPMFGKHHNSETKIKLSQAKKGKCRRPHSDETKAKIARSHEGKTHTEASKIKMSLSHKGYQPSDEVRKRTSTTLTGISSSKKGKPGTPHTAETKLKMKDARHGKRVAQIERDTGNIINVFKTAKEASVVTGVNRGNICTCARGEILSAGGFCWSFV